MDLMGRLRTVPMSPASTQQSKSGLRKEICTKVLGKMMHMSPVLMSNSRSSSLSRKLPLLQRAMQPDFIRAGISSMFSVLLSLPLK